MVYRICPGSPVVALLPPSHLLPGLHAGCVVDVGVYSTWFLLTLHPVGCHHHQTYGKPACVYDTCTCSMCVLHSLACPVPTISIVALCTPGHVHFVCETMYCVYNESFRTVCLEGGTLFLWYALSASPPSPSLHRSMATLRRTWSG